MNILNLLIKGGIYILSCVLITVIVFLYGITIGSFLNVCIYRIPKKESVVVVRSHCMKCGYQLKWYDLIPLFSYLFLRGRCRKCGEKISIQYPIIEAFNGVMYVLIFMFTGLSINTLLYCLLSSALTVIAVIDFRTYEIPFGINIFIGCLGVIRVATDLSHWTDYLIGFFSVSVPLYLLYIVTKGRGIGGGDVKLMAVSGFLIGWKCNILAFVLGCILGSVIHMIRMRVSKAEHVLAMGPYLSAGIMIAALWGEALIDWYLSLFLI